MHRGPVGPGPRQPRPAEAWFLVVTVTAVSAAVRSAGGASVVSPWVSAAVVGASAGVVGLPALAWVLEHERLGFWTAAVVGTLAGAVPPLILLASGILGASFRNDPASVRWALGHGAALPTEGYLRWPALLAVEGRSVLVGMASGIVCWLVLVRDRRAHPVTWLLVAATVAATMAVATLLG